MGLTITNRTLLGCPSPCLYVEYSLTRSLMGTSTCVDMNRTSFWPYYSEGSIKIQEEYRLMDLGAIISATGGSLGLFLGFSCYGMAWDLLGWLETLCDAVQQKRRPRDKDDLST